MYVHRQASGGALMEVVAGMQGTQEGLAGEWVRWMVRRGKRRWMLFVLRRVGERGRHRGFGGERRCDLPCGDLFHRNGSTHARKRISVTSKKKEAEADLNKVVFEQLHAEDVNHR